MMMMGKREGHMLSERKKEGVWAALANDADVTYHGKCGQDG